MWLPDPHERLRGPLEMAVGLPILKIRGSSAKDQPDEVEGEGLNTEVLDPEMGPRQGAPPEIQLGFEPSRGAPVRWA